MEPCNKQVRNCNDHFNSLVQKNDCMCAPIIYHLKYVPIGKYSYFPYHILSEL